MAANYIPLHKRLEDSRFSQAPRDKFTMTFEEGVWAFTHSFRVIDPWGKLPPAEQYDVLKLIEDNDYDALTKEVNSYLNGIL